MRGKGRQKESNLRWFMLQVRMGLSVVFFLSLRSVKQRCCDCWPELI